MSDSEGDEPSKDSLEYKIRLLDEKLARAQVGDETKFKLMAQQLRQWGESLQTERIAREMLNERRTKESKLLESQVKMDLTVLQQARRDEEIGKAVEQMRVELRKESLARESTQSAYAREIGE